MDPAAVEADVVALTSRVADDLEALWDSIVREQYDLLRRWPGQPPNARQRRLTELRDLVARLMPQAREVIENVVPEALEAAFVNGSRLAALDAAAETVALARLDLDVIAGFAADDVDNLLDATRHVDDTTKSFIRRMSRRHLRDTVLGGTDVRVGARRLEADMRGYGISAVTYRNGSRHGLGEYARMVMRTRTAEVYNRAALSQYARNGIGFVELIDSPSCGLTSHDDLRRANGLVLNLNDAAKYPISHPNCVRVLSPRFDVATDEEALLASPTDDDYVEDAFGNFVPADSAAGQAVITAQQAARRTSGSGAGTFAFGVNATKSEAQRRNSAMRARRKAR